jgi:large subunit ribosomal protein L10
MAKTREQKSKIVDTLGQKLQGAKAIVLADQTGLKVIDSEKLRRACKAEGVEFLSVKKTLLKRGLEDLKVAGVENLSYDGSLILAIGADEVLPAKLVSEFAKTHEQVQVRGGVINGVVYDMVAVKALASLPSKNELLAKVVGSLQAPVSGFVNVLAGNLRGLVTVLSAIKDQRV